MIAFLQWTTPLMLAGLGLLTLPLIAHLLSKRSRKRFVVPTIRFMQEAVSQQNHLLRLKRWLLLMLRCLAVAMIVFAFARPVWQRYSGAGDAEDVTAMAIVLDASLSTSQTGSGSGQATLFQHFTASADRFLNELEPGRDLATVVIAKQSPEPLIFQLSPNLDMLKSQLGSLKWKYERADIEGAINEASRQLAEHPGRKVLVIISDLQESNWQELTGSRRLELPSGIEIKFVDQDNTQTENIALSNAQSLPPDPIDGQKIQLNVNVTNYSERVKQVPVVLSIPGGQTETRNVQLPADSTSVVSFNTEYSSVHSDPFKLTIPADQLAADNTAFVAAQPGAKTPIVVISDDPRDEAGTSTFFLERALRPFNNEKDRFSVSHMSSDKLDALSLSPFNIAMVGYVAQLDTVSSLELSRFVSAGGKLVFLCGEGNVAKQIDSIEAVSGNSMFPFTLSKLETFHDFDEAPFISSGKWRGRWLRDFDLQSQVALRQIRFPRVWSTNATSPDADIILTYSNKTPALGIRNYGNGQVVQANLSPSIDFSEFGTYNSFVVLVQVIVQHLRGESSNVQALVGGSILFPPPPKQIASNELSVIGPDGELVSSLVATSDGVPSLMVDRTELPGAYQLRANEKTIHSIAVNIDERESDLRKLSPDQLALGNAANLQVTASTDFGISLMDKGLPLWGWLAMIALVALSLESFLLGWWKR